MGFVEVLLLISFLCYQVVSDMLHVNSGQWLARALDGPVVQDLLGGRYVRADRGRLPVQE